MPSNQTRNSGDIRLGFRGLQPVEPAVAEAQPKPDFGSGKSGASQGKSFDLKPEELAAYLDQYIVRQDRAKMILATKICTHFNRAKYLAAKGALDSADGVGLIKNNILMIGPTGVGKTYLIKLIAAKLGVPFAKGDATKFSETGYVGGDVEDLVRELVHEANGDLEAARFGIVYIDEIDKIAASRGLHGPDVSRTGVQRALLKPMEETDVDMRQPHDPVSQLQALEEYRKTGKRGRQTINTRHILFIMSGAFADLPEVVKKRLNKREVGFCTDSREECSDQEYLRRVTAQDLIEYGFETEFVGRLPVTVFLEELSADDLHQILKNPNNPVIISKKRDFAAYGIELRFEDAALKELAVRAEVLGTGARALVSVVEAACLPFESRLPSTGLKRLLITPEVVADPEAGLEALLAEPDHAETARRYEQAGQEERRELIATIRRRQSLYEKRIEGELTQARMELIADEYHRVGLSLGAAFDNVLNRLDEIRIYELEFGERYRINIRFSETAEVAILAGAAAEGVEIAEYCHRLSQVLEPGLKLVREKTGQVDFHLPEQAVLDTEAYLRKLFEAHYQKTLRETGV